MRLIDADALVFEYEELTKIHLNGYAIAEYFANQVKAMSTIEPERKTGEWTKEAECPFCGFEPWYERDIHTLSFCPNCGADMRGEPMDDRNES